MNPDFSEIPLNEHPDRNMLTALKCDKTDCSESDQTVLSSSITVHPHSGDAYGDYTIKCRRCGKIESFSFADN